MNAAPLRKEEFAMTDEVDPPVAAEQASSTAAAPKLPSRAGAVFAKLPPARDIYDAA